MTGIQYITDGKGRKTAAVIDLKKHGVLWEDIQDILVSRSRKLEKRVANIGNREFLDRGRSHS